MNSFNNDSIRIVSNDELDYFHTDAGHAAAHVHSWNLERAGATLFESEKGSTSTLIHSSRPDSFQDINATGRSYNSTDAVKFDFPSVRML